MNIGIIGAGNVGGTLGRRWAHSGHEVVFAARDLDSPRMRELLASAPGTRAASNAEAARHAEVVLLATPWDATESALRDCGDLAGKVVVDASNPLLPGLAGLSHGCTTSGAEQVAKWAAGAQVVKAFNTVGYNIMESPSFGERKPVMFYCGDHSAAKQKVHGLVAELGFDAVDAGPLTQARLLEPFALLWITLALKYGLGREIGFELLRR